MQYRLQVVLSANGVVYTTYTVLLFMSATKGLHLFCWWLLPHDQRDLTLCDIKCDDEKQLHNECGVCSKEGKGIVIEHRSRSSHDGYVACYIIFFRRCSGEFHSCNSVGWAKRDSLLFQVCEGRNAVQLGRVRLSRWWHRSYGELQYLQWQCDGEWRNRERELFISEPNPVDCEGPKCVKIAYRLWWTFFSLDFILIQCVADHSPVRESGCKRLVRGKNAILVLYYFGTSRTVRSLCVEVL